MWPKNRLTLSPSSPRSSLSPRAPPLPRPCAALTPRRAPRPAQPRAQQPAPTLRRAPPRPRPSSLSDPPRRSLEVSAGRPRSALPTRIPWLSSKKTRRRLQIPPLVPVEEASFVHSEPPQDGSAPPVVSSDMEVLHDKVKKQVIKEGHGRKPIKFATCFACIGGGIQPCRRVARIARRAMHTWTVAGIASWGVPTLADIALDGRRELSLKLFFIY
ncbi:proline-rich receptor-like protein kinase PERK9 isoform X1 [Sorghum bicolor]|uniref:proline-rich receptor-like protein kinase PERK9 isoform X1 n=1 Tax=Sorghum bicolor TaxID=4558 RepID=UPI000B4236DD|nr:proline-rich receptor-like protein kinase PERK9 isoform X1 [Sorghum bicolor]|eukprot:XP_021320806.1 proline-rich receptor-like protein kinase PERK9 isoform X1 [Sorghum bicolor]